jgi:Fe2+ transport system protein B
MSDDNNTGFIKDVKKLQEDLKHQDKVIYDHVILFEQTLKNLIKDKETSKKYQKRIDCLLLTTQIFICICVVLFSLVFLKVF